jgi:hypothetical protein
VVVAVVKVIALLAVAVVELVVTVVPLWEKTLAAVYLPSQYSMRLREFPTL